jgi:hypothetical protein
LRGFGGGICAVPPLLLAAWPELGTGLVVAASGLAALFDRETIGLILGPGFEGAPIGLLSGPALPGEPIGLLFGLAFAGAAIGPLLGLGFGLGLAGRTTGLILGPVFDETAD